TDTMQLDKPSSPQDGADRRTFLKTGTAGAVAAAGFPAILRAADISNSIKVGLVGCGGRGTGAASQALRADDYSVLTSVADIAESQIDRCLQSLKRAMKDQADAKVKVESSNRFL